MISPQLPANEDQRLAALVRHEILDTPSETSFDMIVHLAASLCGSKIALISLIDQNRQWFKAKYGIDATETDRAISFCGHAIHGDDIFEISDALEDERFCDNPLVTNEPNIRFYAGYPIKSKEGYKLGTLCLIDDYPRNLSEQQRHVLRTLGRQLEEMIALRLDLLEDFKELLFVLFPEPDQSTILG